jgi:hypothetical protein
VTATSSSLFAAGTVGGEPLTTALEIDRMVYMDYLRGRLAPHEPGDPLWTGFAYRLYKELVNAGRHQDAEPVFQEIAAALLARRGIDLLRPRSIIAEAGDGGAHLQSARWPFCLAGLLYLRGVQLINTKWDPEPPFPYMLAALDAGVQIRACLLGWGADDGELHSHMKAAEEILTICLDRLRQR